MMDMPITIYSIDGMHLAFTETGENGSIQRQLITPPTPATTGSRKVALSMPIWRTPSESIVSSSGSPVLCAVNGTESCWSGETRQHVRTAGCDPTAMDCCAWGGVSSGSSSSSTAGQSIQPLSERNSLPTTGTCRELGRHSSTTVSRHSLWLQQGQPPSSAWSKLFEQYQRFKAASARSWSRQSDGS